MGKHHLYDMHNVEVVLKPGHVYGSFWRMPADINKGTWTPDMKKGSLVVDGVVLRVTPEQAIHIMMTCGLKYRELNYMEYKVNHAR